MEIFSATHSPTKIFAMQVNAPMLLRCMQHLKDPCCSNPENINKFTISFCNIEYDVKPLPITMYVI
jgi:hypothetical protein